MIDVNRVYAIDSGFGIFVTVDLKDKSISIPLSYQEANSMPLDELSALKWLMENMYITKDELQ